MEIWESSSTRASSTGWLLCEGKAEFLVMLIEGKEEVDETVVDLVLPRLRPREVAMAFIEEETVVAKRNKKKGAIHKYNEKG